MLFPKLDEAGGVDRSPLGRVQRGQGGSTMNHIEAAQPETTGQQIGQEAFCVGKLVAEIVAGSQEVACCARRDPKTERCSTLHALQPRTSHEVGPTSHHVQDAVEEHRSELMSLSTAGRVSYCLVDDPEPSLEVSDRLPCQGMPPDRKRANVQGILRKQSQGSLGTLQRPFPVPRAEDLKRVQSGDLALDRLTGRRLPVELREEGLGPVPEGPHLTHLPTVVSNVGLHTHQHRAVGHGVVRQQPQPPLQATPLLGVQQLVAVLLDQPRCRAHVTAGQRVPKGLVDEPLVGKPRAGSCVQRGHPLRGLLSLQEVQQDLPEEVVIPEPLALGVEGDGEEIAALQLLDEEPPVELGSIANLVVGTQRVAQLGAEAVEDGGPQQPLPHAW